MSKYNVDCQEMADGSFFFFNLLSEVLFCLFLGEFQQVFFPPLFVHNILYDLE